MQTILGASGQIGRELALELHRNFTHDIRLVSRHPKKINDSDQLRAADLLDAVQTRSAVHGSDIVYLTAGLPMDTRLWIEQWPVIMSNVIEACVAEGCKMVFFDNTYMYPQTSVPQTEDAPFQPYGEKGRIRAQIAQQLLDAMAQACIGWSEESDKDHRLYDKVKQTVEVLLKDFDDDLAIFEKERVDFETFLDSNRKRADLAEQRAAEATRGREKLHSARRISAREILQRVEGKEMPEIVRTVLTRPWANYLVLTLLRQGEDSNEWRQALRFADEFVWSAQPKTSDAERMRLKGILPALEKSLRHGLATVAYHENDVKQLMHELNAFYTNLLNGDTPAAAEVAKVQDEAAPGFEIVGTATATAAAIDSPVEEEIVLRAEAATAPELGDEDESLRQVKAMKVGTWIEFTGVDGTTKERAKLSWISPISSKYLFVNRKGLKVADKTVQALAIEIRRGDAAILEEVPLFDRALDAIVERLKAAHAKPDTPAA